MFLASRFVAGETAEDAMPAALRINKRGMHAILDYLGEDVVAVEDTAKAVDEYVKLVQRIEASGARASVSVKTSQMGLRLSKEICIQNIRRIVEAASKKNIMIWFDMEGSALTQPTIDVFEVIRAEYSFVGLCLQAALVRTGGDFDLLSRKPFSVRLCKGAYKEPPTVAYARRSAMEGNFRMLVQKALELTSRGVYPAFATHDPALLELIQRVAHEKKVSRDAFEFQMLYGIQNQKLEVLAKDGYKASVYIPYGTHWLPYFLRRLRERKENLYFLMRNVFRV